MRISSLTKHYFTGLLYVAPWLIGFLVFQLYPFILSFVYSFTDYSILNAMRFVGLDNYIYMFTRDNNFVQSVKVTFAYVFMAVPGKLFFALFIALLLNMKLRHMNFFRTVYYLPSILGSSVGVAILWVYLFNSTGLVNALLARLHIAPVNWLGSPDIALYTISLLAVWQFGSSMVLFLAGLKQIPQELYEAARVDGASRPTMLFRITLPLLTPIIFFNLVMQTINGFQEFTSAAVITNGGPLQATYLYGLMLYENAFMYMKMGYASAQTWFLFAVITCFTALIFKSAKYWTFYEDGGDR